MIVSLNWLGVPLNELGVPLNELGVPPCWRAYFLLLRQKKVAKEKATPGAAPFGFLALLGRPGGLLNSPAAQTTQADCPRPACVAQRLPRGPQRRPCSTDVTQETGFHGQPEKMAKNEICFLLPPAPPPSLPRKRESRMLDSRLRGSDGAPASPRIVSPGPLRGAEQRRKAGSSRRGLSEGRSPEFRSRPACRVAQGTGNAGTDPGVAFSLATFFWPHKRKYARQQGGNPCQSNKNSQ